MPVRDLPAGAALRTTGDTCAPTALCLNGGSGRPVPGDWGPSMELLVDRLAPRFPGLAFTEVRYRIKSWRALGSCIADGRAALDAVAAAGAPSVCVLGFSMGGAVAVAIADLVARPPRSRAARLRRRLPARHPRCQSPALTRRGGRMRAQGVDACHTTLPGPHHGVAVRPFGVLAPLPRAARGRAASPGNWRPSRPGTARSRRAQAPEATGRTARRARRSAFGTFTFQTRPSRSRARIVRHDGSS